MSCSNCFNGCSEIVSDRCVKYTGVDVAVLGIKNGDSLSYVEQALIEFLTSTLDGTGIKPDIDPTIICTLVKQYLPTCGDLTVTDILTALIKAACDLQVQINNLASSIANIEAPYNIGCLSGVTSISGTHNILQAVITKLCTVEANLAALALNVATNYVAIADINSYIAAYLASLNPGGNVPQKTKMLPYTAVEYYGPLSYFDSTGAGQGDWDRIFLCNGLNGTPDKRGRVAVGAIQNIPGGTLDPEVNPLTPTTGGFNPNYALYDKTGLNYNILGIQQMPSHTHVLHINSSITPNPHNHGYTGSAGNGWPDGADDCCDTYVKQSKVEDVTLDLKVSGSIDPIGGGDPHDNKQPVLACYYVMYIP